MPQLWKPSNGSEGDYMWQFCENCERDRASWPVDQGGQDRPEDGCRIIALFGMNGEHEAWIIGEGGKPRCTQFVEEGKEIFVEDTETLDLFD